MAFITLGNLTRFLDNIKTYLNNTYLKLSGGTVTGAVTFTATPTIKNTSADPYISFIGGSTASQVDLSATPNGVKRVSYNNQHLPIYSYTLLDSSNYKTYAPSLTGTGASGTWDINISGNAANDSDGNKIIDTYAKKTDVANNYVSNPVTSDLDMNGKQIILGDSENRGSKIYDDDGYLTITAESGLVASVTGAKRQEDLAYIRTKDINVAANSWENGVSVLSLGNITNEGPTSVFLSLYSPTGKVNPPTYNAFEAAKITTFLEQGSIYFVVNGTTPSIDLPIRCILIGPAV